MEVQSERQTKRVRDVGDETKRKKKRQEGQDGEEHATLEGGADYNANKEKSKKNKHQSENLLNDDNSDQIVARIPPEPIEPSLLLPPGPTFAPHAQLPQDPPQVQYMFELSSKPSFEMTEKPRKASIERLTQDKWLTAKQLKELRDEGVPIKMGKWSASEEATLRTEYEAVAKEMGKTSDELYEYLFDRRNRKVASEIWKRFGALFPERPLRATYVRVRNSYHPDAYGGKWTEAEDVLLREHASVAKPNWQNIGKLVGRAPMACKDRWRDIVDQPSNRVKGRWTPEETAALEKVVADLKQENHIVNDNDIPWNIVSQRFGEATGRPRNRRQCFEKWQDQLVPLHMYSEGDVTLKWSRDDDIKLLEKLIQGGYGDETEIVWSSLVSDDFKWTTSKIRERWRALRRAVQNQMNMEVDDIAETLLQELRQGSNIVKGALKKPAPTSTSKKKSAAIVESEESEEDDDNDD